MKDFLTNNIVYTGRRKLSVGYRGELNEAQLKECLVNVLPKHYKNVREIKYLNNVYLGKQDILNKENEVRREINHTVVENHTFAIVEFKKNYVHGNPISYNQTNNGDMTEVEQLAAYMESLGKADLDKDTGEDRYIFGTGYRMVTVEDGKVPFNIYNLDIDKTFCVYSSHFTKEKLFGCIYWDEIIGDEVCRLLGVYTKNKYFEFRYSIGRKNDTLYDLEKELNVQNMKLVREQPHILNCIPIIEYPLNRNRFGLVELVDTNQKALNHLTSYGLDDVEQFIQSLIVFFNTKLEKTEKESLYSNGIIQIPSTNGNAADVKMLSKTLDNTGLKLLYDRIHRNMMVIAGVPIMSDKNSSGGDTGQARLVGEGWTMADERAHSDEKSFEKAERELLEVVLNICHKKGLLKSLTNENIQIKFNRTRNDNLLTKVQAFQILNSTNKVDLYDIFKVIDLFPNPLEVYQNGMEHYEKMMKLEQQKQQTSQPKNDLEVKV